MKNIYLCVYFTSFWIWLEDQILIFMEIKKTCMLFVLFLWYKNVYFTLQDHKRIEAQKMEIRENQLQMMISMSTKTHWSHLFSLCTLTAIDFKGSHVPWSLPVQRVIHEFHIISYFGRILEIKYITRYQDFE